ncbi:hypothetical protein CAPTEDRAFT_223673 [Capitella teleta]|uniref:Uncharacterized protein n=1 Tax=Capitella teleta TaxID=283909 RepID=R7V1C3_CAPTE|nr:hypothetical protein CAPTEDRAFT_223673 [Capitella teleta]|eukprot:ELU09491.1 hypothetical protein CAPTEDRAFT_223673 [Capitella teleta]
METTLALTFGLLLLLVVTLALNASETPLRLKDGQFGPGTVNADENAPCLIFGAQRGILTSTIPALGLIPHPKIALGRPQYSFPNSTVVLKRNVTCDGASPLTNVYPSETWSCRDMRIDGYRMRYWYRTGTDQPCTDAPPKFDANMTYRNNDESGLCRELLKANNIVKPLSVAYVHDPSCSHSVQQRIILEKNLKKGHLNWKVVGAGPGYMRTLRCMVKG